MLASIARILDQVRSIPLTGRRHGSRRRINALRRSSSMIETFELRTLLSANALTSISGSLSIEEPSLNVLIEIDSPSSNVPAGINLQALNPDLTLAPLDLTTEFGNPINPLDSSTDGFFRSYELASGQFRSEITALESSVGSFRFDLTVKGDVDRSGQINQRDTFATFDLAVPATNGFAGSLRKRLDIASIDSVFAADVNNDGNINLRDVRLVSELEGIETSLRLSPVNTAPTLDNSGSPEFDIVTEDQGFQNGITVQEILNRSANGDPISDPDLDAQRGIAVIGLSALGGRWDYATDESGDFNSISALEVSENSALLLIPDARIRFTPDAQFSGSISDAMTFRAWDQTAGANGDTGIPTDINGGRSSFSEETETVSLTVEPISLELDFSASGTIDSADGETLITNQPSIEVAGTTSPLATVQVSRDGDGLFDDGTAVADENGDFTLSVNLAHDDVTFGRNDLVFRAVGANFGLETEVDQTVHRSIGTVTRFTSNAGSYDIELLDSAAPETVANFLNYETRYEESIIHRSPVGFVIQGGGFAVDPTTTPILQSIPTDAPVDNAFDPANGNLRGTLSTAQTGGDIDSFTSQWFVNVSDNSFLDSIPHTVFGRVIGDGIVVIDDLNAIPIFNIINSQESSALGEVPLQDFEPFSQALTGTISVPDNGNLVTGTGTSFTTDLVSAGGQIQIAGFTFTVNRVISDTELLLSGNLSDGITDGTAFVHPAPTPDQFVVFESISTVLPPA